MFKTMTVVCPQAMTYSGKEEKFQFEAAQLSNREFKRKVIENTPAADASLDEKIDGETSFFLSVTNEPYKYKIGENDYETVAPEGLEDLPPYIINAVLAKLSERWLGSEGKSKLLMG